MICKLLVVLIISILSISKGDNVENKRVVRNYPEVQPFINPQPYPHPQTYPNPQPIQNLLYNNPYYNQMQRYGVPPIPTTYPVQPFYGPIVQPPPTAYPYYPQPGYPYYGHVMVPYPGTGTINNPNSNNIDPKNYPHIKTEIIDVEDDGTLAAQLQYGLPIGYTIQPIIPTYTDVKFNQVPQVEVNSNSREFNQSFTHPVIQSSVSSKPFTATITRVIDPSNKNKPTVIYGDSEIKTTNEETTVKTSETPAYEEDSNDIVGKEEEPSPVVSWLNFG